MTVFDPSGFSKGTHAYEVATRVRVVLPQVRSTKVQRYMHTNLSSIKN